MFVIKGNNTIYICPMCKDSGSAHIISPSVTPIYNLKHNKCGSIMNKKTNVINIDNNSTVFYSDELVTFI